MDLNSPVNRAEEMSDDLRPFHFNNLAFLLTLNLLLMAVGAP